MSISEKIKAINNKIEQNKVQYNLDWQIAKFSALSSGNVSKYEYLFRKHSERELLEKAAKMKRFEYSPLDKIVEKQTVIQKQIEVINKKEDKSPETIIGTDEKYLDKVANALLYFPREQVEQYVEIDNKMKPEDLVYGKHKFNRYGMIIFFVTNLKTEVTNIDEMYKMLNEFNNEINELKSYYLARQDEEIDDVIENDSLVYNNQ